MMYWETLADGSFKALGAGFQYDYDSAVNRLSVIHGNEDTAFAKIRFNKFISQNPTNYVEALDKAHQIKALMLSNNATTNLAELLEASRLGAMIKSSAKLSSQAYDLNFKNFSRFSRHCTREFNLKHFKIKRFCSEDKENTFFVARIQTHHDNAISVRACTLEGMISSLSERTLRDLITMEFGHQYENSAVTLLNLSTKLSTISRIIDKNFHT